ncbi:MAG: exported hypothetical protein [Arenicellales bacterium IbO2]|nr:MAG: exported hypothetical protein [Arenicellales bacterium IbO2]
MNMGMNTTSLRRFLRNFLISAALCAASAPAAAQSLAKPVTPTLSLFSARDGAILLRVGWTVPSRLEFQEETTVDIKFREDDWKTSTPTGAAQLPEGVVIRFRNDDGGNPLSRTYGLADQVGRGMYNGTYDVRISLLFLGDDFRKGGGDDVRGTEFSDVASIVIENSPLGSRPAQVSDDATLSSLRVLSGGTDQPWSANLFPAFSSSTFSYATTVLNRVSAVRLTPTAANPSATITLSGSEIASGSQRRVNLNVGANRLPLEVTAADQTTKATYTMDIERVLRPVVEVDAAASRYVEGSASNGQVQFPMHVRPPGTNFQVRLDSADGSARAGADYTAVGRLLTLSGAASPGVVVADDALVEPDENFSVTVSKPSGNTQNYDIGASATTVITIVDDDRDDATIAFGEDPAATAAFTDSTEEGGAVTLKVSISHSPASDAVFTVERDPASAASQNDYTLSATTLTFPANASAAQRTQSLEVSIQNDTDVEEDELLVLRIAAADSSAPGLAKHYTRGNTARLLIADDDGLHALSFAAVNGDSAGTTPGIAWRFAAAAETATTYSAAYKKLSPGAPDSDFTGATVVPAAAGADNLAFSVRGLDAASLYELRVTAHDMSGNSGRPVSVVARTPSADCVAADTSPCPPSAPQDLGLAPVESGITATWSAPIYAGDGSSGDDFSAAPQIIGYTVTSQIAGSVEVEVARADATALRESIGDLNLVRYTVRVRAQNDARAETAAVGAAAEARSTPLPPEMQWGSARSVRADAGARRDITLTEVSGGLPPLSYAFSGLPPGLSGGHADNSPRPRVSLSGIVPDEKSNIRAYSAVLAVVDAAVPPNRKEFAFTVTVLDKTLPRIVPREGVRGLGLLGADWTDPGADCLDNFDETKDATANVANVDKDTAGDYTVTYTCADAAGNDAEAVTRAVKIRAFSPDVNDDGAVNSADGILIARHLFGVRGEALADGQANLPVANMETFIAGGGFNVDGNTDAGSEWWDGVLLLRYLLGLRGADLIAEHPDTATLDADAVAAAIAALLAQ